MVFALAGNQNCGKTTLFNQLTGSNQHVGNFPGVTVDKKEGVIRGHNTCEHRHGPRSCGHPKTPAPAVCEMATVVDLPGIYSLSPYTSERSSPGIFSSRKSRMVSSTSWTPPTSSETFTCPCSSSS